MPRTVFAVSSGAEVQRRPSTFAQSTVSDLFATWRIRVRLNAYSRRCRKSRARHVYEHDNPRAVSRLVHLNHSSSHLRCGSHHGFVYGSSQFCNAVCLEHRPQATCHGSNVALGGELSRVEPSHINILCKRRTFELLYRVSFALLGLAPRFLLLNSLDS